MKNILLDTDIGSDIDDAVALAYLLARNDCNLLGITTVSGEPVERAKMASAQCVAAGKHVPIYPGAADPLIVAARQPRAPQADMLNRWPHESVFPKGEAVSFLRETIRKNPGEVSLFAIGPLTNIALLFKLDPEIPALLKEFVIMGGEFRMPPPPNWKNSVWEWNIYCDPHAAAIVFNSDARMRAVGIQVTMQCQMPVDDVRRRFSEHALLHPVRDFAEVWFNAGHKVITFHDPLAAAMLFDDSICTFEDGVSTVELADNENHARTYWTADPTGRHSMATAVDSARFFEHYFSVFQGTS